MPSSGRGSIVRWPFPICWWINRKAPSASTETPRHWLELTSYRNMAGKMTTKWFEVAPKHMQYWKLTALEFFGVAYSCIFLCLNYPKLSWKGKICIQVGMFHLILVSKPPWFTRNSLAQPCTCFIQFPDADAPMNSPFFCRDLLISARYPHQRQRLYSPCFAPKMSCKSRHQRINDWSQMGLSVF